MRAEITRREGLSRARVTQLFRLLDLPVDTQRRLLDGKRSTSIRAAFDDGEGCKPREQGFGVGVRTCGMGAGYTSCHIWFADFEGKIFDLVATCRSSERSWDAIAPVIERAHASTLGLRGFERDGRIARSTVVDEAVRARAAAAVAAKLQPPSGAVVPPELVDSFERLTSARGNAVVGTYCGVAGSPPEGRQAMQALVDAGRDDLLRDALRSMNAGGRLYGYVGLRLLGRNTPDDDAAFDVLSALPIEVETCGGCSIDRQTAADIDIEAFRPR